MNGIRGKHREAEVSLKSLPTSYPLPRLCVLLGFISSLVWIRFSSWMCSMLEKLTQDLFGYHSNKSKIDSSPGRDQEEDFI